LNCPGSDLKNIYYIRSEQDAAALVRKLERETGNRFVDRKLAPLKGKSGVLQSSRKLGVEEQRELMMRDDDADNHEGKKDQAVILGGGYLGVELACAIHGWGFEKVHLAFHGSNLYQKLPWDAKFRQKVQDEIVRRAPKLELHPNTEVERLLPREETALALGSVVLNDGTTIDSHMLVSAIGGQVCGKELFPKKAITLVNKDCIATDEMLRLKSSETKDVWICGDLAMAESGVECVRAMGKHAAISAFNDHMMQNNNSPPFKFPALFRYSRLFEYTKTPLIWNQIGDVDQTKLAFQFCGENNICGETGPFATFHYVKDTKILKGACICGAATDKEFMDAVRKMVEVGQSTIEDAVKEFSSRGYSQ
jgi:pyruvate/2-oxoglutarate dehydrogenase complex dihydrolipoamide dehydrogenase (E3) component